ncbi:MAG: hypothetical protein EXS37_16550 [Opitutus sp.]|nr:hypothetical protein [Opitutus sp.]
MRHVFHFVTGWLVLMLATSGFGVPAVAAQEVEVTLVKFSNVRAPTGSQGNWLEADVGLLVKPVPGSPGQMVSRVKVSLLVGFELPGPAGGDRRLEHFRAEADCVALESGRADVRFYLPHELVKRHQLHGDPKYWGVELSVGGKPVPAAKAAYSASLPGADQRKISRPAPFRSRSPATVFSCRSISLRL